MRRFSDLSVDEFGNIAQFSSKKNFNKIRPYISDFSASDYLRCKNLEETFERKYGVTIEDLINRLDNEKVQINDLIDNAILDYISYIDEKIEFIEVDDKIRAFFYNMFLFNFNTKVASFFIQAYLHTTLDYIYANKGPNIERLTYSDLKNTLMDKKRYDRIIYEIKNDFQYIVNQLPELDFQPLMYLE